MTYNQDKKKTTQTETLQNLDQRIETAQDRWSKEELESLLEEVHEAIAYEMSSDVQFGSDFEQTEANYKKWQIIHKYVQRIPFQDDPELSRAQNWLAVRKIVLKIEELELIEWVDMKVDSAIRHSNMSKGMEAKQAGPTFLVLLNNVASRKRKAHASLNWSQTAQEENGWTSSNTFTLGKNLLKLHAESIHSRDNPNYTGPAYMADAKK